MTTRRTVTVLGATGSVGTSTLDLIAGAADDFEVIALTANADVAGLAAAAKRVGARHAVICQPEGYAALKEALSGTNISIAAGPDAVVAAAQMEADWTMAAIVGCAGLMPTLAALERGRYVAFANKEALVSAGPLMMQAAKASGATLLPVDSEHNAVFQCLDRSAPAGVARIILTASGGPFRTTDPAVIETATPQAALKHPNWTMGAKISIDSATMMNKGLELIEASYLFDMPSERLDVVIHPQSVIHSMVEYRDGSVLAQLGAPDMRIPIAHCLAWPKRMATPMERLDLIKVGRLDFEAPDLARFPALQIARDAMEAGAPAPAILNAANEIAVAAFLRSQINFGAIARTVHRVLTRFAPIAPHDIADVLAIDAEARALAHQEVELVAA